MFPSFAEVLAEAERASERGEACRGEALGRRALRMTAEAGVDPKVVRDKLVEMYARRPAFDPALAEHARGTAHRAFEVVCECALMQPDLDTLEYRRSEPLAVTLLLLVPEAMTAGRAEPARVLAPFVEAIFANANLFLAAKQPGDLAYIGVRSFTARERPVAELLRDHVLDELTAPVYLPSALFVVAPAKFWPIDPATFASLAGEPKTP